MPLHFRIENNAIVILGNTFAFKDHLKEVGAIFDGQRKIWVISDSVTNQEKITALCRATGGGPIGGGATKSEASTGLTRIHASGHTHTLEQAKASMDHSSAAKPKKDHGFTSGQTRLRNDAVSLSANDELQEKTWSIRELLDHTAAIISRHLPASLWLVGEIQNLNIRDQGVFFSFAEEKTTTSYQNRGSLTIPVTIWNQQMAILKAKLKSDLALILKEGQKIRALVGTSFYRDRAQLSLNILDFDLAFTKGDLALKREKLVKELKQKNLYDKNRSLRLPKLITRIGLITAKDSRAYSDFIDQLKGANTLVELDFFSAPMQGENSAKMICEGIKTLVTRKVDVIIITRGGGSGADLEWFNDADLAYAICQSKVPILSAIGHHDDTCIAEEVSFHREKTPTAASDFLAKNQLAFREQLKAWSLGLSRLLEKCYHDAKENRAQRLDNLRKMSLQNLEKKAVKLQSLRFNLAEKTQTQLNAGTLLLAKLLARTEAAALSYFAAKYEKIRSLKNLLRTEAMNVWQHNKDKQKNLMLKISQIDPGPWLEKGWTELRNKNGEKIFSVNQVLVGDKVKATLKDGTLNLDITGTIHTSKSSDKGESHE